jgi:hypothetical protein
VSSTVIEVADAVTLLLNGGPPFTEPFLAKRAFRSVKDLENLAALTVTVVPRDNEISTVHRGADAFECAVDVAVQQKVDTDDSDALDALMGLVEEIIDRLRTMGLPSMPAAIWVSIENKPVFAPEHLVEHRVFTSLLTSTYRVNKSRT